MAGTNSTRPLVDLPGAPAIILVEPQLSENIGTTARAMLNCGLTDLRLVNPREHWLSEKAIAASSGAVLVLEQARRFDSTTAAIADLERVYATTARNRTMEKEVVTPRQAAAEMRAVAAGGLRVGVMFGRERSGLENDDVSLADKALTVPLNPGYSSLNLAQAVLLIGYEWFQLAVEEAPADLSRGQPLSRPATKGELTAFFEHLERELDDCGFLRNTDKRPTMVRNIRNMFQRGELTAQEIRTLHGIVHELVTYRHRKGRLERGEEKSEVRHDFAKDAKREGDSEPAE